MAARKGTQREIATQGLSSPDGLGISTQGFIEPIIGDLILGGGALTDFRPINLITGGNADFFISYCIEGDAGVGLITGGDGLFVYRPRFIGSGGLVTDGKASIEFSITPVVGGNVSIGGSGNVEITYNITPDGGLVTEGTGNTNISYDIAGTGGFVVDGDGNIAFAPGAIVGEGGIVIGGSSAIVVSNVGPREFGRGGTQIPRRHPMPDVTFEPPIYKPDDYLEPMDYLKKIQDALEKSEKEKLQILRYLSKGTIRINGRGQVVAVFRDQPDGEVVVANNPPLEPIILELPNVFSQGATAKEIRDFEDSLFLNDIIGAGNYRVQTGDKRRYVQNAKKSSGGEAKVKFVSGAGHVNMVTRDDKIREQDDDAVVLNMLPRSLQDQEEEELRLLGIID